VVGAVATSDADVTIRLWVHPPSGLHWEYPRAALSLRRVYPGAALPLPWVYRVLRSPCGRGSRSSPVYLRTHVPVRFRLSQSV